jgi:DNA-binding MarR family transcriptional regulator
LEGSPPPRHHENTTTERKDTLNPLTLLALSGLLDRLLQPQSHGALPPAQARVLAWLASLPTSTAVSVNEIRDRFSLAQATASELTTRLVQAGYVTSTRDARDARRAQILITPVGRRVLRVYTKQIETRLEALSFSIEETRDLDAALEALAEGLREGIARALEAAEKRGRSPRLKSDLRGLAAREAGAR